MTNDNTPRRRDGLIGAGGKLAYEPRYDDVYREGMAGLNSDEAHCTVSPHYKLAFSEHTDVDWKEEQPEAYQYGRERAEQFDGETWRWGAGNPFVPETAQWYAYNVGWNSVTRGMK